MKITMYSMDGCKFCDIMLTKLTIWGFDYEVANISHDSKAKAFVLDRGLKVVPQLFIGDLHINEGVTTFDIEREHILDKMLALALDRIEKLERLNAFLEEMRPHWAKGYTEDGQAAQAAFGALNELWKLLGAIDQTDAVAELKELKKVGLTP